MPLDYHLFHSLLHYIEDKIFINEDHRTSSPPIFFNPKPKNFRKEGILFLQSCGWQVIDDDGASIFKKKLGSVYVEMK